jgi:hypothetical protein
MTRAWEKVQVPEMLLGRVALEVLIRGRVGIEDSSNMARFSSAQRLTRTRLRCIYGCIFILGLLAQYPLLYGSYTNCAT